MWLFVYFGDQPLVRCIVYKYSVSFVSSFCSVMASFAVQKLLSLIRSHLFLFVFFSVNSRRWIQEDIAEIYISVLPVFSS